MSTFDCMVLFGPVLVFVMFMAVCFGVHHYMENRNG